MEDQEASHIVKRRSSRRNQDKIFSAEADMVADAKEDGENASESESSYDDRIDAMEEEEFTLTDSKVNYKDRANRRKAAGDKAFDTNIEELVEQEDEADDTVFIDNLPKDEASLRYMIKEVNYHVRDLERQFFIEEDSEVEEDLK